MSTTQINISSLSPFVISFGDKTVGEKELNEAALLVAWTYLTLVKNYEGLPSLSAVLKDELDLRSAYKKIASTLEKDKKLVVLGQFFRESQLPGLVSDSEVKLIIKQFNSLAGDETACPHLADALFRKGLREWDMPSVLAELMMGLGDSAVDEIYIPGNSSWKLAIILSNSSKSAIVESEKQSLLMLVISLMHDIDLITGDPIASPSLTSKDDGLKQFQTVFVSQPYNLHLENPPSDIYNRFQSKTTNSVVLAIEHGLAHCTGKMIALVPQSFLFHRADNYELRVSLVDRGILDLVIQLPGNITGDDSYTPLALIVTDENRDKKIPVMFLDAIHQEEVTKESAYGGRKEITKCLNAQSVLKDVFNRIENDYSAFVTQDEIINNGYDLSVRSYSLNTAAKKINELANTKSLSSFAHLIRAQLLKENDKREGDVFRVASSKDISENGILNEPEKQVVLTGKMRDRAKLQRLQKGDILISIKGVVGTVAYIDDACSRNWVANQIFMIVRLHKDFGVMTPKYLFRYLKSPLVQSYFQGKVIGNKVQSIKGVDIKELLVPIPSIEEMESVLDTDNSILSCYYQMDELRGEIDEFNQQHWPVV